MICAELDTGQTEVKSSEHCYTKVTCQHDAMEANMAIPDQLQCLKTKIRKSVGPSL